MTYHIDAFQKPKAGPARPLVIGAKRTYHGAHGYTRDGVVKGFEGQFVLFEIDGNEYKLDRTGVR